MELEMHSTTSSLETGPITAWRVWMGTISLMVLQVQIPSMVAPELTLCTAVTATIC